MAKKYSTAENVIDFLEVSAKSGQKIEEIFYNLGKKIKDDLENEFKDNDNTVKINNANQGKNHTAKNCQC